jgi:hypothetical protein
MTLSDFSITQTGTTAAWATTWASPRELLPGQLRGERNGQSPTLIGFAGGMGLSTILPE